MHCKPEANRYYACCYKHGFSAHLKSMLKVDVNVNASSKIKTSRYRATAGSRSSAATTVGVHRLHMGHQKTYIREVATANGAPLSPSCVAAAATPGRSKLPLPLSLPLLRVERHRSGWNTDSNRAKASACVEVDEKRTGRKRINGD